MRNEIARCLHGGMLGLGRHLRGVGKKEGPRDNNRRLIDSARARVAGHASLSLAVASSTNNDDDDGNNMNHMNERAQNVTMGTPPGRRKVGRIGRAIISERGGVVVQSVTAPQQRQGKFHVNS